MNRAHRGLRLRARRPSLAAPPRAVPTRALAVRAATPLAAVCLLLGCSDGGTGADAGGGSQTEPSEPTPGEQVAGDPADDSDADGSDDELEAAVPDPSDVVATREACEQAGLLLRAGQEGDAALALPAADRLQELAPALPPGPVADGADEFLRGDRDLGLDRLLDACAEPVEG